MAGALLVVGLIAVGHNRLRKKRAVAAAHVEKSCHGSLESMEPSAEMEEFSPNEMESNPYPGNALSLADGDPSNYTPSLLPYQSSVRDGSIRKAASNTSKRSRENKFPPGSQTSDMTNRDMKHYLEARMEQQSLPSNSVVGTVKSQNKGIRQHMDQLLVPLQPDDDTGSYSEMSTDRSPKTKKKKKKNKKSREASKKNKKKKKNKKGKFKA